MFTRACSAETLGWVMTAPIQRDSVELDVAAHALGPKAAQLEHHQMGLRLSLKPLKMSPDGVLGAAVARGAPCGPAIRLSMLM